MSGALSTTPLAAEKTGAAVALFQPLFVGSASRRPFPSRPCIAMMSFQGRKQVQGLADISAELPRHQRIRVKGGSIDQPIDYGLED
jgi:hypothetical protein